jgi:beta-lactamase regulating signal transducer with metallopeptidase domain
MNLLVDSTVRMSAIVLAGFAAAWLLRRQSAALRHFVLVTALVCAAATPPLVIVAPSWRLPIEVGHSMAREQQDVETTVAFEAPSRSVIQPAKSAPSSDAQAIEWLLAILWIGGTVASIGVLLLGAARLRAEASRAHVVASGRLADIALSVSRDCGVRRRVSLLQTGHPTLLVTWGVLRPKVMMPLSAESWPDDRLRVVLSHEMAHVRRGDWLWHMMAELARAVCWFNPLLWIASRRIRQESERACDDEVLRLGVRGHEYAAHLLELAATLQTRRRRWSVDIPAPAIVGASNFERRITAMLNTGLNRNPLTHAARALIILTLLIVAVMIAGLHAGQAFATLSGTVADPSGAFLPDTTVTLMHVQSQAKHEVHTDATGRFQFVGLPAGDYRLKTQSTGFADLTDGLTLASGQTAQRNVVLQVGSLQETITVVDTPAAATSRRVGGFARTAPACTPSGGGGQLTAPRKVTDVRPQFPPSLHGSASSSHVMLEARIGVDGTIKDVRAVQPVDADVEDAAISAVKQWEFTPTLLNCVPVEVTMKVSMTFKGQ